MVRVGRKTMPKPRSGAVAGNPGRIRPVVWILGATMLLAACAPSAPASPTAAPAKPTEKPSAPAASPAAKPAESPAAKPAASPAASPAAASGATGVTGTDPASMAAALRALPLPAVNQAEAEAAFRGKTITITIGYAPGGGADSQARLLAEQLPKYIPGNPTVAVANMPGADSLVGAQALMRRSPDGLNVGHFSQGLVIQALTGKPPESFDPLAPVYLGMVDSGGGPGQLCARTDVANSLDAFLKSPRKLKLAEISPASNPAPVMEWLKIVGLPIETVYGYGGTSELRAAFDRRESELVDRCGDPDIPLFPHWFQDDFATPLFHWGPEPPQVMKPLLAQGKYPWYKSVLEAVDETPAQRRALETFIGMNGVHIHALPPRTPDNIVNVFKRAYIQAMSDDVFVRDLTSRGLDYAPLTGDELRKRVEAFRSLPPEVTTIIGNMVQGGN